MKQENRKHTDAQIRDTVTSRYRWAVVWCKKDGSIEYRYPTAYGMRATVRLANRLNREWTNKLRIVEMARNSYTIGV